MTMGQVTKRNFCVSDIEENIPGTFHPKNILPEVKLMAEMDKQEQELKK
jgi:hypothetical protein